VARRLEQAVLDGLTELFWPLLLSMPRVLTAAIVAPLFPPALFPVLLRNTVTMSLALAVYPYVAANMPPPPYEVTIWIGLMAKEMLLGSLIGVAVGALFWAMESAGELVDLQVGTMNAVIFDPFGRHQAGPFALLMGRLAIAFFVACGGLYMFVSLLFESFRLWPLGSFQPDFARFVDLGGAALGSLAELAVRFAAPLILLLALIDLGFGLVNRAVPQLNVFFFTMPIKGALAALMLALFLVFLADIASSQIEQLGTVLERIGHAPVGK
jgi:type III secretion protein T